MNKVKNKWKDRYSTFLKVWEANWNVKCALFNYSKELRQVIIESLNYSYRKYTKTKGFSLMMMDMIYNALKNILEEYEVFKS